MVVAAVLLATTSLESVDPTTACRGQAPNLDCQAHLTFHLAAQQLVGVEPQHAAQRFIDVDQAALGVANAEPLIHGFDEQAEEFRAAQQSLSIQRGLRVWHCQLTSPCCH